ncbi:MAG: AAA family ATPase [Anaerolineales bacterium]|nr:AAA family ATPase [Anaerolineales bacterium]
MDKLAQEAIRFTHRVIKYCGLLIVFLSTLGLLSLGIFHVTQNRWTTHGPAGKTVNSLAVPPSDAGILYAGTRENGVYKRTNGGNSWTALNNGLDNLDTNDIAIDNQGNVYVGTYGSGVYELLPNARLWKPKNTGLDNVYVYSVATAPDGSLYAGTNGNGIFKMISGSDHWRPLGLGDSVATCQIIDPQNDQIIYVGTWGNGVYKTSDGGTSWKPVSEGLGNTHIRALALEHNNPLVLYAGTWGGGVYKTTDGGESWTAINDGLRTLEIYALACTDDGETIYVGTNGDGLYRTVRGADSWVPYGLNGSEVLALNLTTRPIIYAGTDNGVHAYDVSLGQRIRNGTVGSLGMLILGLVMSFVMYRRASPTPIEHIQWDKDTWKQDIQELLLGGKAVEARMLKGLPREKAVHTLRKYRQSHPEQDLVYVESAQRLASRSQARLSTFSSSWTEALDAISHNQFEAFESQVIAITDACCETLGFVRLQRASFKRLLGIMVDTPTMRLGIPSTFPVIYLYRDQFTDEDIADLRDMMAVMNVPHRFAFIVTFGDPQTVQQMLDEYLRPVYSYDFVVLGENRIQRILMAKDPRQVLIQSILEQIELTVISPFSTAGPTPENMFIGRDRELKEIETKIANLSFALVGNRRIGKTSIILRVQRTLQAQGRTTLFLDCHPVNDYKDFFELISTKWELDGLSITDYSPLSFAKLITRLSQQAGSPVIILLDEVDHLLSYDKAHDWVLAKTFRSLSQEGRCRFLFAGIKTLYHQSHNSEAPFFNFCHTLIIRYLERKDAKRLIMEPMTSMGIVLENERELLNRILDISTGHPGIVQRMCAALIEEISKEGSRRITLQHVHAVLQSGEFQTYRHETILGVATPLEKIIALTLENEKYTLADIQQKVGAHGITPTYAELDEALDHLKLYSVLQETGKRYSFLAKGFPKMVREALDVEAEIEMLKENLHAENSLPNY